MNCRIDPRINLLSVSALRYEFPVDAMIKRFKYDEALHLARPLASLLVSGIRHCNFPIPDAIVTVPLHDNRLRERGFNQSQELAELVAGQLGLPLINAVQRIRDTPKQSNLDAAQRRKNLRHAFLVVKKILPKRIAIVDDVMTTGSTVNALARQLHAHAVSEIQSWTIARVCHD